MPYVPFKNTKRNIDLVILEWISIVESFLKGLLVANSQFLSHVHETPNSRLVQELLSGCRELSDKQEYLDNQANDVLEKVTRLPSGKKSESNPVELIL